MSYVNSTFKIVEKTMVLGSHVVAFIVENQVKG